MLILKFAQIATKLACCAVGDLLHL